MIFEMGIPVFPKVIEYYWIVNEDVHLLDEDKIEFCIDLEDARNKLRNHYPDGNAWIGRQSVTYSSLERVE
jgi:hypothetical protein